MTIKGTPSTDSLRIIEEEPSRPSSSASSNTSEQSSLLGTTPAGSKDGSSRVRAKPPKIGYTKSVSSIGTIASLSANFPQISWFDYESKHDVPLDHDVRSSGGGAGTAPAGGTAPAAVTGLRDVVTKTIKDGVGRLKKMNPLGSPPPADVPGNPPLRPKIPGFGQGEQIAATLAATAKTPGASIMVLGYSPTGNGHTPRCLNIVRAAVNWGRLKPGSTVILQVPQKWGGERSPLLPGFARFLLEQKINVINFGADKSVQGFLKPDGGSDDATLLHRFAMMPRRQEPDIHSLTDAEVLTPPAGGGTMPAIDYEKDFPVMAAKEMFKSLKKLVPSNFIANHVYTLTDMAPDLQKAAQRIDVPDANRVDQENHAILLRMDAGKQVENLKAEFAVLGKVLNPYGGKTAYIGLGDKNSLSDAEPVANALGITPSTRKKEAMRKVAAHMLACGLVPDPDAKNPKGEELRCAGVMTRNTLDKTRPEDIENIVFVYAHNNQNRIARYIREQLDKGASDAFNKTMFIFAGKAIDAKKTGVTNALHAAYLAHGDGISTMGAGVAGELAYLHAKGGAKSPLGALPIRGHNEQEANALAMKRKLGEDKVDVLADTSDEDQLRRFVDDFVHKAYQGGDHKLAGSMKKTLNAIGSEDTYLKHAVELLFGVAEQTKKEKRIVKTLDKMAEEPLHKASRHFNKIVLQVLQRMLDKGAVPVHPQATLAQKPGGRPVVVKFTNFDSFVDTICDDKKLQKKLRTTASVTEANVKHLKEVRECLKALKASPAVARNAPLAQGEVQNLKELMGELTKTGF